LEIDEGACYEHLRRLRRQILEIDEVTTGASLSTGVDQKETIIGIAIAFGSGDSGIGSSTISRGICKKKTPSLVDW
uniref:Uncharacterized protein n=1 Tax=Oryza glaberrima TaxID=4538 RepID=I1QIE8_ORYGL